MIDERAENIGIISQFITTRINLGDLLVTHSTAEGTEQYQRSIDEIIKFTKIEDTGNKLVDLTTAITTQPSFQPLAFEATKRLSFIKITQGLFADAINYSKAILAFREGASLSNPDSIRLQEGLADSYIELGNAYLEAGLIDFAMESFTKSASIAGKLSQTDSKNVIYKRIAALAKDGIGRAMLSKGAVDDALDVFTANVEYAKPFVLADKTNKLWAAVLGIGHERVGDALMLQEKFLDAAQQYQIEHDLVSSAVSANPDEDTTWQMRLAIADFKFAKALIGEGKRTAAIPYFQKSALMFEEQSNRNKDVIAYQADVHQARWRLAELADDMPSLENERWDLKRIKISGRLGDEQSRWLIRSEMSLSAKGISFPELANPESCSSEHATSGAAATNCDVTIDTPGRKAAALAIGYQVRGNAYRAKGEFDKAIEDYNEAIKVDPNDASSYNFRGLAFQSKGLIDESIADFNEAIRLRPTFAFAHSNRGLSHTLRADLVSALSDFNEMLRLAPDNAVAHQTSGRRISLDEANRSSNR